MKIREIKIGEKFYYFDSWEKRIYILPDKQRIPLYPYTGVSRTALSHKADKVISMKDGIFAYHKNRQGDIGKFTPTAEDMAVFLEVLL